MADANFYPQSTPRILYGSLSIKTVNCPCGCNDFACKSIYSIMYDIACTRSAFASISKETVNNRCKVSDKGIK